MAWTLSICISAGKSVMRLFNVEALSRVRDLSSVWRDQLPSARLPLNLSFHLSLRLVWAGAADRNWRKLDEPLTQYPGLSPLHSCQGGAERPEEHSLGSSCRQLWTTYKDGREVHLFYELRRKWVGCWVFSHMCTIISLRKQALDSKSSVQK